MITLLTALAIVLGIIGFFSAGLVMVGRVVIWLFRLSYELGKIIFVFFVIWLALVLIR